MRALLVAVTAAVVLALPASAASPPYVVQGDRVVGGLRIARGTLAQARQRFGPPSTVRSRASGVECNANWHRIGLKLAFLDFSGRACQDGVLVTATITSRSAWRTAVGLRVGDSVARIRRLYPRATPPPRVSSVDRLLAGHAAHLRRGRRDSVSRPARARSRRSGDGTGGRHRALRLSGRGSTSAGRSFHRSPPRAGRAGRRTCPSR